MKALILHHLTLGIGLVPCLAETVPVSRSATINFAELAANERPLPPGGKRAMHSDRRVEMPDLKASERSAAAPPAELTAPPAATTPLPFALTGFPAALDTLTTTPPDSGGAVGPQHVVTVHNDVFQIQRRSGVVISHVRPETFWLSLAPFFGLTDPRIIYDSSASRWIAAMVADPESPGSALFVGVSRTSDPTGNWFLQRFEASTPVPGSRSEFFWADYPTLGFNRSWAVVTINTYQTRSGKSDMFAQSSIYVFNKAKLYAGTAAPPVVFKDQTVFFGFAPATDYDNSSDALYLVGVDSEFRNAQSLRIGAIQGPVGSETYARKPQVFASVPWEQVSFGFVPQLGDVSFLDGGDDRMQNCVLRQKSLWCAHTIFPVGGKRSTVQWFQIETTNFQIVQVGRIDDPTNAISYAYPSIAVNKNGDAVIGYSRFSARQYPSSNYSLRLAADPPNTVRDDTLFKEGGARYGVGRWGDYSTTLVDQVDDTGFWTIQEYAASPTSGLTPRDRWATWWAQLVPINPATAPCAYSLAQTTQSVPGVEASGSLSITTAAVCPWLAAANAGWISIQDGTPGIGNGTVRFSLAPNPSVTAKRTGTITAGGQTFIITQDPAPNAADLLISELTAPGSATIGGTIKASATLRNMGGLKTGAFRVAFYLSGSAAPSVVPADAAFYGVDGGLDPFASMDCAATVAVPLSLAPGTIYLAAVADDQNLVAETDRTNNFRLSDRGPIALSFDPARPILSAAGVMHGATLRPGPVAPGLIVLVSGSNLGPASATDGAPDASGKLATTIAGAQLLCDQVPAPLLSARQDQLRAIIPYAVAGKQTTQLQINYQGVLSNIVTVPVTDAAPGLFTVKGATGQAVASNEDLSANSSESPAAIGSVIRLRASGEGQTDPPGIDGQFAADTPPEPLLPVTLTIGDQPAEIVSVGGIPNQVAGYLQITARVPDTVSPGDAVPVVLTVRAGASQSGVTIAVKNAEPRPVF